ncbi:MAG: GIY-YIG nuclease family protein [Candidatus Omnitrophota bacterium]|nr:GIY-YIG nuclease family protein [Candidatus Omnitrophota bacterium]
MYRVFEKENSEKTIYIGKSKSLQRRIVGDHYKGDRIASTLKSKLIKGLCLSKEKEVMNYLSNNCSVQFMIIEDKDLLTRIEHFAVAVLTPKWND